MELIPPIYWMIVIAFVAGFICFVLYQLGMLFKETKDTVKESRGILEEAQETVKSANEILAVAKETVFEVNNAVIGPIKRISSILSISSSFLEGLTSRKR